MLVQHAMNVFGKSEKKRKIMNYADKCTDVIEIEEGGNRRSSSFHDNCHRRANDVSGGIRKLEKKSSSFIVCRGIATSS